ncbi:MAG: hypothetical protein JWQ88_885 [Rhodoferax sp.]|nr:hypothetical protein [Rhodoferax sp.]
MNDAGWLGWLGASPLSQWMRGSLWLYPLVETVHIVGFVVLVGSVVAFDLRLLGFSRSASALPVQALGRHLLAWSALALLLVVPAGVMMFSAHPHDFFENGVFRLKLALIAVAGLNAVVFHLGVYRGVAAWNNDRRAPMAARLQACVSIALWVAVIACGRLLAYT